MSRYVGVDLHKNMFVASFYDADTGKHHLVTFRLKDVSKFKRRLRKTDILGVECTTNTRYFVEQIEGAVASVKVVNPSQFKVISRSVKKTDENDARVIAEFLSKDMIPEVRLKEKRLSELSSMAHTRDKLVKLRTALKNKIHNILNSYGIVLKKEQLSSDKALNKILKMRTSETARIELEVIISQIKNLNEGIKKLDSEIEDRGKTLPGHENITSIKGIGDKSGTILLCAIGNVNDFESEKKLASYFGIVPRVSNSNETMHQGRITKHGNKLARTTLVQCTLVAIRYSPYLRAFYDRIKAKKGSGKAIIATSKKLLGIIYQTLKNNWVFEDFPNFVLKSA